MKADPEIIPPPEKPKRPAEFTDEIFDTICERMAGGEWLRKICDQDPNMPSRQTFLRWIEKDSGRQEKYARASRSMVDYWAEELLEISQETEKDTIIEPNGRRKCNHEWVANKRLHSDNLKFLMSKIYPKRYGDRLPEAVEQKTHEAALLELQANQPMKITWEREIISPIHDDHGRIISASDNAALRKRIAELEERLGIREGAPQPPKLIGYDPGPLPSRMDGEVTLKLVNLIKENVPRANDRDPLEVLEEVLAECAKALQAKYGATADAA